MPPPSSPQWSYCLNFGWRDSAKKNRLVHVWHTESKVSFQRCTLFKFIFKEYFSSDGSCVSQLVWLPCRPIFKDIAVIHFAFNIKRLSLMEAAIWGPLMR